MFEGIQEFVEPSRASGEPLLFKGRDFALSDSEPALG